MDTCLSESHWEAYLQGDMEGADDDLEAHLRDCPGCHQTVERLQARLLRAERPASVPTGLRRRLDIVGGRGSPASGPPVVPGYPDLRHLSWGGMSVVYQAIDDRGLPVAIKFLDRGIFATEHEIEGFLAEAERLRTLWQRPRPDGRRWGFIEVRDSGQCPGSGPYIVMELAAGGSLHERIRAGPIDPNEAARAIVTVADTVEELHNVGLVHRDLKPSNVLLQTGPDALPGVNPQFMSLGSLQPLVSDLGVAKVFDPATGTTTSGGLKGTPEYMAPELFRGIAAGRRSDVYALGATFYELLTGRPPFGPRSTPEFLSEVRRGHPTRPKCYNKQLPTGLEAICLRCLERRPEWRYQTARALAEDLRRYLACARVEATLPSRPRRAWGWVVKNPAPALVITGLSILVAAAVGWGLEATRRSERDQLETLLAHEQAERAQANAENADRLNASAEQREQIQLQARHDATVRAAREAARRGDWHAALGLYETVVADKFPDEARLRAERLFGFFVVNDEPTLRSELTALTSATDLGELQAQVFLVQGAHLLCDSGRQEEGRVAVRKALATEPGGLAPADRAFAEALIETRPRVMIEALRRAVRLDPLHQPAHASLVVALVTSGQLNEAHAQAELMESLFPASPVPPVGRALVALLRGDRPTMRAELKTAKARLHDDLTSLTLYCEALADALDILAEDSPGGRLSGWDLLRLGPKVVALQALSLTAFRPLAFAVPTAHAQIGWFGQLLRATQENTGQSRDAAFKRVIGLSEDSPEGYYLFLATVNRFRACLERAEANDLPGLQAGFAAVADLAYRAAEAPTLLVRSPFRYYARMVGICADIGSLKLDPDPERSRARLRRVRDQLPRLVADGRQWPITRREALGMVARLILAGLTPELTANCKVETAEGATSFRLRSAELAGVGRAILADWLSEEPKSRAARSILKDLNTWEANGYGAVPPPIPQAKESRSE